MLGAAEILLIGLILAVVIAAVVVAVRLAGRKGRNPVAWGLLVFAFLPLLLILALLPPAKTA